MRLHNFLVLILAAATANQPCLAQNIPGLLNSAEEDIYRSRISEYFYMRNSKDILKPVRVLGQVEKPGLYHIPQNTSLTNLLALTGGPRDEADIKRITVTRKGGAIEKKDLMKLVSSGEDVALNEGDMIFVPKEEYFINQKTSTILVTLATVLSVSLTAYVVFRNDNR